jgi:hypothetical protein
LLSITKNPGSMGVRNLNARRWRAIISKNT